MQKEEKHICCYCGEQAFYQLKNGKWCCKQNARSCDFIKNKVAEKAKHKWKQLKERGINNRKDIPENQKKDLGTEGICYYCGQEAKFQLKNGRWCCREKYQQCPEIRKKNSLKNKGKILSKKQKECRSAWNKNLSKESDERLRRYGETYKRKYAEGKIKSYWKGMKLPSEMKEKISVSMKKAHREGRAHNIGESRWNNQPSYPEKFFMKVIENEFFDKNYIREYPFKKYSLDFAWVHKKKVIEIDGEQHERFEEYKNRDKEKDTLLKENGWKVIRIKWKDMIKESKHWIKIAKEFIDKN